MSIHDFIQPNDKAQIFHSSGYARVARGAQIGGSDLGVSQRGGQSNERQSVAAYRQSMLGAQYGPRQQNTLRSRLNGTAPSGSQVQSDATGDGMVSGRQAFNAGSTPGAKPNAAPQQHRFSEPARRPRPY